MAQHKEIIPLQLFRDNPGQNGLPIGNEITLCFLALADVGSKAVQLLRFVQDLYQCVHVVVLQLGDRQVDEVEGVQRLVRLLVDQLELDDQHVFFQFGFLVWRYRPVAEFGQLLGLFLVQDDVLQVGLGESSVNLIDFGDLTVLRNNAMPGQHCFPLVA